MKHEQNELEGASQKQNKTQTHNVERVAVNQGWKRKIKSI